MAKSAEQIARDLRAHAFAAETEAKRLSLLASRALRVARVLEGKR